MRNRITLNADIFYAVIFANIFANFITDHLSYCIVFGEFPDELKRANTITVYKKNESYGKTNYRPVSIVTKISNSLFTKQCRFEKVSLHGTASELC